MACGKGREPWHQQSRRNLTRSTLQKIRTFVVVAKKGLQLPPVVGSTGARHIQERRPLGGREGQRVLENGVDSAPLIRIHRQRTPCRKQPPPEGSYA